MKNWTLPVLLCLLASTLSWGQGIAFEEGSWEELKAIAAKEQKIIFMDAYAVWCGPCKAMSNEVFTTSAVGDFFNSNFINVKMDMERGEGTTLAQDYQVRAYPTLLFIDSKGKLLHSGVGYHGPEDLIELGEKALDPDQRLAGMIQRYENGDRTPEFLRRYAMIRYSLMDGSHEAIVAEYMATQTNWDTPENMGFIFRFAEQPDSRMFAHLLDHRSAYEQLFGEEVVYGKMQRIIFSTLYQDAGSEAAFERVRQLAEKAYPDKAEEMTSRFRVIYFRQTQNTEQFINSAVAHYDQYPSEDWGELNEMAWIFYELVADEELLEKAAEWAKRSVELEPNYYNYDTLAALYAKLGKKGKARKAAEKAIALGEAAGEDVTPTRELLESL